MACNPFEIIRDPAGCAGQVVEAAVGDAIENMASAVMEAFGQAIGSLGTVWVHIGTPNLTGSGGGSAIDAGSTPPEVGGLTTVLGYVTWVSLAVAIISLFVLGGMIATRMRAGEGVAAVGRVGLVLAAVVLISGASAIVTGLLPDGPNNASGAVLFLQSGLWYFMGAAAILSVIIGGARMAWENRAEPGRELVRSLLTLVVVAGAGVTIVGLLVTAADSFSVWLINGALSCDVTTDAACFGESMLTLLALSSNPAAGGLGALLVIILGLIAILAAAFQIVLMVARGGMLVILAGILPLSASFTNTEMGKGWFKKCIAWLVAFILYKPAAAIVYAAAFQLVGTDVFSDDGSGFLAVLTGLMLMLIALFALPALMRFVTPMVGAMAGGAGGALAMGALAALPSGAAALGRLASGSGSGSGSGSSGSNGGSGATGNDGQGSPGPSGDSGPSGNKAGGGGASQEAQSSGPQQTGGTSTGAGGGTSTPSTGTAAASAGGGGTAAAGAGGGAAAGGAAAGGGAAAAGAAAGPVGVAAGAALEAGKKAGQAAAGAAQSVGQQATGDEGGGPDGSR